MTMFKYDLNEDVTRKTVIPSCEKWLFDPTFKGITTDWYHVGDTVVSTYRSASPAIKKDILNKISCPLYKSDEFKEYLKACIESSRWIDANVKPIANDIYYKNNNDIAALTKRSDELKMSILTNNSNPVRKLYRFDPSATIFDTLFDNKSSDIVRPTNGSFVKLGWIEADVEKLLTVVNLSFGKDRYSASPRGEMAVVFKRMVCWYTSDLMHDNSGRVPRSLKVVGSLVSNRSLYRAMTTISNAAGKVAIMLGKATNQNFGEEIK